MLTLILGRSRVAAYIRAFLTGHPGRNGPPLILIAALPLIAAGPATEIIVLAAWL